VTTAVRALIRDGALRARFGVNAASLSRERLDARRTLASYLALYGELAAR
jgi:hypothetical protein